MNEKILNRFREGIPYGVDTGSSMRCLLEWLLCKDIWIDEYKTDEFLAWIREKGFTEEQLKKVIYQLDRERILAIDPDDEFIEVEKYKPNTCRGIRRRQKLYRIEQKYGHLEEENIEEIVSEKYLLVHEKDTRREEKFKTTEAFESHYGIGWEDRKEKRKGQPSKYDNFEIAEKYEEVKKFAGNTEVFIRRPDGSKLYEGKEFEKLIRIFAEYKD